MKLKFDDKGIDVIFNKKNLMIESPVDCGGFLYLIEGSKLAMPFLEVIANKYGEEFLTICLEEYARVKMLEKTDESAQPLPDWLTPVASN
jgi:hypothetical protein